MSPWKYYLEAISDRLAPNYDLSANETVAGQMVDLVARFKMRSEKYFLLKKITLYAYENHETVLIQGRERITPYLARQYCGFLQQAVLELVNPDDEHMYSLVTGVLVARRGLPRSAVNYRTLQLQPKFQISLQGWCECGFWRWILPLMKYTATKPGARSVRLTECRKKRGARKQYPSLRWFLKTVLEPVGKRP